MREEEDSEGNNGDPKLSKRDPLADIPGDSVDEFDEFEDIDEVEEMYKRE